MTTSRFRVFPDDVYDLAPATWADIDPALQDPASPGGRGRPTPTSAVVGIGDRPAHRHPCSGLEEEATLRARERSVVVYRQPALLHSVTGGERAGRVVAAVVSYGHVAMFAPLSCATVAERLVIIGGDAGGMAAVSQARRTRPDLEIVAFERGNYTCYSACGIPYLVGGEVATLDDWWRGRRRNSVIGSASTSACATRSSGIDLDAREVEVRDHRHNRTLRLGFDEAARRALGASDPARPPGHRPTRARCADARRRRGCSCATSTPSAAARRRRGRGLHRAGDGRGVRRTRCEVTVVEAGEQVMRTLDPDMAARSLRDAAAQGRRAPRREAKGSAERVVTDRGAIHADLVVLGIGVRPTRPRGGRWPRHSACATPWCRPRQRASASGVWAAGDCCESIAPRQREAGAHRPRHGRQQAGRVAGTNIGGGYATFPGVVGTAITESATPRSRAAWTHRARSDGRRLRCSGARSRANKSCRQPTPGTSHPP